MPTVEELKQLCRDKGIKGYSGMNKAQLMKHCGDSSPKSSRSINTTTNRTSKVQISNKSKPTPKECEKWLQNKSVNPRNGNPVSKNGRIEKVLQENCQDKPTIRSKNPIAQGPHRVHPKPKRGIAPRVPPKPKRSRIQAVKQISLAKIDMMSNLPEETKAIIIQQMELDELVSFAKTTKRNRSLVSKYTFEITDSYRILTNELMKLFPNIIYLDISNNPDITDNSIKHITKLKHLKVNYRIGDEGIKYLTNLVHLNTEYNGKITDEGIKHLTNLVNLTLSNDRGSSITDEGLKHLTKFKMLNLEYNENVTGTSFKYLSNLETLDLKAAQIESNYLNDLPNLKKLYIRPGVYIMKPDIEKVKREYNKNDMSGHDIYRTVKGLTLKQD